jgi:hypothetical protein
VKIIDPPTSSSSPKYHCLGAKHILWPNCLPTISYFRKEDINR